VTKRDQTLKGCGQAFPDIQTIQLNIFQLLEDAAKQFQSVKSHLHSMSRYSSRMWPSVTKRLKDAAKHFPLLQSKDAAKHIKIQTNQFRIDKRNDIPNRSSVNLEPTNIHFPIFADRVEWLG
jgi:hypothetical protein